MPRITDATISGTTTNWMASKKSLPGKATQAPMISAISASTQPVVGPMATPKVTPSAIAIKTCSQSRVRKSGIRRVDNCGNDGGAGTCPTS
jgi:hypothetical protein